MAARHEARTEEVKDSSTQKTIVAWCIVSFPGDRSSYRQGRAIVTLTGPISGVENQESHPHNISRGSSPSSGWGSEMHSAN